MTTLKKEVMHRAHSDHVRHHLETDNARLREALTLIADIGEGGNSVASLRNCARIARNALVSAAPVNPKLSDTQHPAQSRAGNEGSTTQ